VTLLGKRPQNDDLGLSFRESKDGSQRVLKRDCPWKINIVEKLLHSAI
jgi:hypothetical protein